MVEKTDNELQREIIAEQIKKYLAEGGMVKNYVRGETNVVDPLTKGWGLKPAIVRNKRGR